MKLEGVHHITCITGDAPRNVEFYVGVLGLRMVKKTVNQDVPTIYHLFYADENGDPGSDITFFEYPGAGRGQAGMGMIHRIVWRVGSDQALEFWEKRLTTAGAAVERVDGAVRFKDPEGLGLELRVVETSDEPLRAIHPDVPEGFAIQGFDGARAFTTDPERSRSLLEDTLGFSAAGEAGFECRGDDRGSLWEYDPTSTPGSQGAGTVHHVAWASRMEDHEAWRDRVADAGASPTPVIDRFWFRSIYFREPSGVLFEIATLGPGFTTDESLEHLGESLTLPPNFEHLREELEATLTPLPDVRRLRQGAAQR